MYKMTTPIMKGLGDDMKSRNQYQIKDLHEIRWCGERIMKIHHSDLLQYQFEYQQALLCISIGISMYDVYNYIIAYNEDSD